MSSLTGRLAEIVCRPVGARLHQRAALHVLDWVGCAVAGLAEPVARPLATVAAAHGGGECLALGAARREAAAAILVNGGLGNALEMDDIHREAVLHPGPVVIPAALAAAEAMGAEGGALLDAVVRGYEAMIRVGRSLGPAHYRLWHNTATAGPFGAAAAVGSLLGLSPARLVHAFGNAGTQASGLWQVRHGVTMSKQLHTARAAQSGWLAATLAREGFTGAPEILEGPQGFFAAMCPDGRPDLVAAPAPDWLIAEVGFKPYPACRHTHAAIDAALRLHARLGRPRLERIDSVLVTTYAAAVEICDCAAPETPLAARFSLQHAAAVALLDGLPGLSAFDPPTVQRPDIASLRARTRLHIDPGWGEASPIRFRARIRLALRDGTTLEEDVPDALGDPANPLPQDALEVKAVMLMRAGGLSPDACAAVLRAAAALAHGGSVAALTRPLAALSPTGKDRT